ncbi:MAG: hypothetical protein AABO41_16725 [Acidobacteriota bacterium]
MAFQKGRSFITILLAVVVLGGWFSGQNEKTSKAPVALAQASAPAGSTANGDEQATGAPEASVAPGNESTVAGSNFEDGYRAGYRDAQRDCAASSQPVARTRYATRSRPRVRVAGARYYAEPRRGHSTRDMILRIAAPAAIGAGIGAIAGGKRGAGAGALIGGGGGALYHLLKHRRD